MAQRLAFGADESPMRTITRQVAALLIGASLSAPVAATELKVDYRITLAGLTLGNADLQAKFVGDKYDLRMNAQLTGLAGLFTASGRGGAVATGTLSASRPLTSGFSATGKTSSAERTVQVALSAGNASEVKIEPPFELRPDRVPLDESHKRSIVDPLSALLALTATSRGKPDDPASCNRTLPVFDGTQRFDVVLSYVETKRVQKPGYTGNVLVCSARYVPIAGHRPQRWAVKYMQENRDMGVWLAPVDGTRVLVPLRIHLQTYFGMSIVEAERWARE